MKNWKFIFAAFVSFVIGIFVHLPGTSAASYPCRGYGGCVQLEMTPLQPAAKNPAPTRILENSIPRYPHASYARRQRWNYDRDLHQHSTPQERAETQALNLESTRLSFRGNYIAHAPPDRNYLRIEHEYELELRRYRASLKTYELSTTPFFGSSDQPYAGGIRSHYTVALPSVTDDSGRWPLPPSADTERLSPWGGGGGGGVYNRGPGNGY
jgi:hypothetical protein